MSMNRRRFHGASLAALGVTFAGVNALGLHAAQAQPAWPSKPVRLVVGFPAGSSPDLVARTISEPLGKALGQPVVVDNKGGAAGNIGADQVAKATDDHTIGLVINGTMTTAKALYKDLPFDPTRDFSLLSLLATSPLVLVTGADQPTGKAFFAKAAQSGTQWNYGSIGVGSTSQLGMEYLKGKVPGMNPVHVPFQGNPQVVTALLGGQVQLALVPPSVVMPQVKAGKLHAVGLTTARTPLVPDVPSLSEAGIHDFNFEVWYGLAGPARLSAAARSRIETELGKIMQSEDVRRKFFELGLTAVGSGPQEFEARVKRETAVMGNLIATNHIALD